jgi:hypothetical protein
VVERLRVVGASQVLARYRHLDSFRVETAAGSTDFCRCRATPYAPPPER